MLKPVPAMEPDHWTNGSTGPQSGALHIRAVGVNFRDVLNVLGAYPGDPGPPGADCAGVWAANVEGTVIGEGAFGFAPGALASMVGANMLMMPPKPEALTFEAASGTPTVFVTVQMALQQANAMRAQDGMMIHAATGGVGLAALQLASPLGCRCSGTAGGPNKRTLVRTFGAKAAVGSRDTRFVDNLAAVDGGSFPGGVLNSLTSAGFLAATLSILGTQARFVEIGKRDVNSHHRLALEREDVSYHMLATDFLPMAANCLVSLHPLACVLAQGLVSPLQQLAYSMGTTPVALRMMSQAKHIGKVVVNLCTPQGKRSGGLYILSGGLGALGMLTAEWLRTYEQSPVWLLGRSGRVSGQDEALGRLWQSGALVSARRSDVSCSEEASSLVPEGRPLRGFVHAGGILKDGTVTNMTHAMNMAVFAPKVGGLENMDTGMHASPMDAAIMFSSISSLLGGVG
jgi:NADPH:quinone reductase-like Zn-dependent oxidoreductase